MVSLLNYFFASNSWSRPINAYVFGGFLLEHMLQTTNKRPLKSGTILGTMIY